MQLHNHIVITKEGGKHRKNTIPFNQVFTNTNAYETKTRVFTDPKKLTKSF